MTATSIDPGELAAEWLFHAERFGIVAEVHNGVYDNRHCEALAREVVRLRSVAAPPCGKCGYDPTAPVSAAFAFVIERDPPSLNARVSNTIISGHKYRRERDTWCLEFRRARLYYKIPYAVADRSGWQTIKGKRRVTITREYGGKQRERDRDNLAGGMKPLVDAMVSERLLADDNATSLEIHYQQLKIDKPRRPGLRFQIEILETPEAT